MDQNRPKLAKVEKHAEELADTATSQALDPTPVRQRAEDLKKRYAALECGLKDHRHLLENVLVEAERFNRVLDGLESWVTRVSQNTSIQEPITIDPLIVQERLAEIEVTYYIILRAL